jgi:hypothetical protein
MRSTPSRVLSVAALALSVAALAACGESSAEKAKAEVCAARKVISNEIKKLQGLTISTSAVDEAKASFETINKELKKIKDAQPKLEGARKEQVEAATKSFESSLNTIASSAVSGLSSGSIESAIASAGPKLKSAVNTLASDYAQALGPISCS